MEASVAEGPPEPGRRGRGGRGAGRVGFLVGALRTSMGTFPRRPRGLWELHCLRHNPSMPLVKSHVPKRPKWLPRARLEREHSRAGAAAVWYKEVRVVAASVAVPRR